MRGWVTIALALLASCAVAAEASAASLAFSLPGATPLPGPGGSFDSASAVIAIADRSLAVADFDGDGALDAATANFQDGSISVLKGGGDGTFGSRHDVQVGCCPTAVASADFNGDHKADLVTADPATVLLGNGDLTFAAPTPLNLPSTSVAVGDINGDHNADVVLANQSQGPSDTSYVTVLLGNGNGTFQAAKQVVAGSPIDIAVADTTGDGHDEIVSIEPTSLTQGNVVTYGLDGGGALAALHTTAWGDLPLAVGVGRAGGGAPDVALAFSRTLVVAATGSAPPFADIDHTPSAVAAADFDKNGVTDVAAGYRGSNGCSEPAIVGALRIAPSGAFTTPQDFTVCSDLADVSPKGSSGRALVPADVNGDGWPDLVIKDAWHNVVAASVSIPAASLSPTSADFGQVTLGAPAARQRFTLGDAGGPPLVVSGITVSGPNATDFGVTSDGCGGSVESSSPCTIDVAFAPNGTGTRAATLTVDAGGPLGHASAALTGQGVAVPPPAEQPVPPPPAAKAPVLVVHATGQRFARTRSLRLLVSCDIRCVVDASAAVKVGKKRLKVSGTSTSAGGGAFGVLTLHLARADAKRILAFLHVHRRLNVSVTLAATANGLRSPAVTRVLRLRP